MEGLKFIALNISEEGKIKLALLREKNKIRLQQMTDDFRNGRFADVIKDL